MALSKKSVTPSDLSLALTGAALSAVITPSSAARLTFDNDNTLLPGNGKSGHTHVFDPSDLILDERAYPLAREQIFEGSTNFNNLDVQTTRVSGVVGDEVLFKDKVVQKPSRQIVLSGQRVDKLETQMVVFSVSIDAHDPAPRKRSSVKVSPAPNTQARDFKPSLKTLAITESACHDDETLVAELPKGTSATFPRCRAFLRPLVQTIPTTTAAAKTRP